MLDALEQSGLADRTIVVFTSDHGMPFPFARATGHDHGSRTPLLLHVPGAYAPRDVGALTSNIDLTPTLLDLLGVAAQTPMDGTSWLPLIEGGEAASAQYQFTYVNSVALGGNFPERTIQDGRYALIFAPWSDGVLERRLDGLTGLTFPTMERAATRDAAIALRVRECLHGVPLAFYDREKDPGERINLIEEPRHKARIAAMTDRLKQEMVRTGDPELINLNRLLAGEKPIVVQDPERYRQKFGSWRYYE